jgi:hypothetical protein
MPDEAVKPLDQMDMRDYKAARNGTAVADPEPQVDEKDEKDEKEEPKPAEKDEKKVSGGWQKRIDRLTKHNSSLEEKLAAAQRDMESLRNGKKEEPKAAPVEEEPKREAFSSDADYIKAMIDFGVSKKLVAEKLAEQKRAEDARIKEVFDAYNKRLSESRSLHDDFDEIISQEDVQIPQAVQLAIFEMENGPEVVYFLGKNPEICEDLMKMSQFQAIGKVWRISEGLEPDEAEEKEEEAPKAKAKEPEEKPKAKFAPIKPVSGGSTRSSKPLDSMDMVEFKKARAAGRIS